ncbi:MAG: hypothetical protein H0U70_13265 [Tatlockia sp.]|nr:hypothetical protein [Tatlockia sp.]
MNFSYFFHLLWRNICGTLSKSFENYPFLIPIHLITLGLSILIPALIKTITDCWSRIFTYDKTKLAATVNLINEMDEGQMQGLVEELRKPGVKYQSNSSQHLFTHLSSDNDRAVEQEKLTKLREKRLKTCNNGALIQYIFNGGNFYSYISQINVAGYSEEELNDFYEKRAKQYDQGMPIYETSYKNLFSRKSYTPPRPKKIGLTESRTLLSLYMSEEKNNGKSLFQRVERRVGLFEYENKFKWVETPTSLNNSIGLI